MPSQENENEPGTSAVAVRRAVAMPVPAKDPGAELGPRTPEPAAPTIPGWARRQEAPDPESASSSAAEPRHEADPVTDPVTEAEAEAEAVPGGGAGGAAEGGEALPSPSSGPRKPMLAAAGIAGALLVAVAFLVLGLGNGDKPKRPVNAAPVGGVTLAPGGTGGPAADYAAESPSATSSVSPSLSGAPSAPAHKAAKKPVTAATHKAGTTPSATPTTKKTKAKPLSDRALANAASTQASVLLKNLATGLCADVPNYGNGTTDGPVNQYPCNGTTADNQLWNLEPHSESGKGPDGSVLFLIRNSKDRLCMDLPYYGAASAGTRITEYPCQATTADNQYWWLDLRSDGRYWIRNYASRDLCLNVAGAATGGNDAALQIGICNDSSDDDDHWYFV